MKDDHIHFRKKCIFCKTLISHCRCDGTSMDDVGMHSIWGICPKCSTMSKKESNSDYQDWINPNLPLQFKEFFLKVGNVFYYYINGVEIANKFTGEFVEGGSWTRYKFIPKNEIWIDIDMIWPEICLTIWHESFEAQLILQGNSYSYSHECAQHVEDFCRQNEAGKPGTDQNYLDTFLNDNSLG